MYNMTLHAWVKKDSYMYKASKSPTLPKTRLEMFKQALYRIIETNDFDHLQRCVPNHFVPFGT